MTGTAAGAAEGEGDLARVMARLAARVQLPWSAGRQLPTPVKIRCQSCNRARATSEMYVML